VTLRVNREGFLKFQLRPRRLVDVGTIDMTIEIFGTKYDSPIVIAPTGSNRAFHPDGEVAVSKAARAGNHLQIISSGANTSIEEAIAARGAPMWFQVYPRKWEVTEALARRAERAGSPVLVVTVDGGATNCCGAPTRGNATAAMRADRVTLLHDARITMVSSRVSTRQPQYHKPDLGLAEAPARCSQDEDRAKRAS
jgi:isopentenyl diphosphate isomerase/L-lactate dehydrogenase-like FMN-dependent dehydrogenase